MAEQRGKEPPPDLESTGTLRLVRADADEETLAAPPETSASAAGAEAAPVQQTLPLSTAQSASNRSTSPQPAAAPTQPPVTGGTRFRHLRAWREGGLGKVWIALDEELHREVALKEIKPQHAGNKNSQDRFLVEGEITGSLEHPGIVPVYGMGRYSDGRPYYAMRFVDGQTLEEAIHRFHGQHGEIVSATDETQFDLRPTAGAETATDHGLRTTDQSSQRSVAFRELLGRFIAVCNAIGYAHSRGVIHRDLKPGNILLARYGETLVVDWGLAKVAGQTDQLGAVSGEAPLELQSGTGTAQTRLGAVVGTPAFMSPEQAEGRQDLIGSASDIYSLGATLYMLLTGRCPFMDPRLDTVLANVRSGNFPRPRQLKPEIPRALEAICLKAMALKREDRYPSASALAKDLERWLADEPVTAYPEPPHQRIARWVRRHKAAALSSAMGLLLVAVVSIVAAVLINRQRQIANQLADENGRLAVQERAAKEQSEIAFREARNAVDDLFTKVSEDSLLNQPGMRGVRKDLLQNTLDYYERFLKQRADDPSVKEELASTLFRAGRIIDELQSPEKALPYFQRAIDIQQKLVAETPGDSKRLQALGDSQNALGRSLHRGQQFDNALIAYTTGRDLRHKLVELVPGDNDYRRALANSEMNIGLVEKDLGLLDAAATQLQIAQQFRQALVDAGGDSAKLQRDLAMGSYNEGLLELKRERVREAATCFENASTRFQHLQELDPRDLNLQFLLATCLRKSADAESELASPEEAEKFYDRAINTLEHLVDRNPEVVEYQSLLAGTYENLAHHQQPPAAIGSLEKSRSIFAKLVEQYPANPQFRRDLAAGLRELARQQIATSQTEAARQNLRSSLDQLRKLNEEFPDNKEYHDELNESQHLWDTSFGDAAPSETV